MRIGFAERAGHNLAATSLSLEAEIAVIFAGPANFEAADQQCIDGQLVALALSDRKIERAAAALASASLMDTANGRQRLEASAQSWERRAELIQGLEDSIEARRAIARAEWEAGEAFPDRLEGPGGAS